MKQRPQLSEAYYQRLNDPRRFPTPQSTIDAIKYRLRERGPGALQEPANLERWDRCDAAARKEINERIGKLGKAPAT